MDTVNLELLLNRIAKRLDTIYDEFQWHKGGSFGEQILNSLAIIEESLSNVNKNLATLDQVLAEIKSAIDALKS